MTNLISMEIDSIGTQPRLNQADLRHFSGDLERYFHPLNRNVLYTPGVKYVAEVGQAYWLIDAIASYFGSPEMNEAMHLDSRLKSMQFWRLDVSDQSAVLTAQADSDVDAFIRQDIPYTDFPLDHIEVWAGFDGKRWTLYLPSEH